jgi:hypothetical protein
MDFILPKSLMSGMVFPTNCAGEPTLSLLFSLPLLGVLGRGSPFLIVGIIFLVPLSLSSELLRILQLHGLHQIHLRGLSRVHNSLSTTTIR